MHRPVPASSYLSPLLCWMLAATLPAAASDDAAHKPAASRIEKSEKSDRADKVDKADKAVKGGHGAAAPADPAVTVAEAAAPAPVDPVERLRQRLAERLAGSKTSPTASSGELQVVARTASVTPVTAAAAAPVRKPVRRASTRPGEHDDGSDKPAHWSYGGNGGPQAWAELKPEFALCGSGQRQSPIDIRGGLAVDLDPVRFDYRATPFSVVDNGYTVQVNVAPGNTIDIGGKRFDLLQFHFHRPAEERIDGRSFEMSLHLVHKDEQGRLAVVAVLFEKGEKQSEVQKVWNNLPLERNQEASARTPLELLKLLPDDRRYITYMGSLTTPPCSEGVQWIVMRQPVTLTAEQIGIFARIYPMNARPLQAAAGRRIIQSQ